MKKIWITTRVAALMAALALPSYAQQSPATGNAAAGKALYSSYVCFGCHGYNGETGNPRLLGNTSQTLANEANFIRFLRLRADRAPVLPVTSMPNYPENSLSDQQARDIYAYIRSFKSTTPEVKDVPVLNQILAGASRPYRP